MDDDASDHSDDFCSLYSRQVSLESCYGGRPWEVEFSVLRKTTYGDEVVVVGCTEALGSWDPASGIPMGTSPDLYPRWCCTALVPPEEQPPEGVEYKFIIRRTIDDRPPVWEAGPNRRLDSDDLGRLPTPWFGHPAPPVGACHEVVFEARCEYTDFGDSVVVVGSVESLGDWEPAKGLKLTTDDSRFPWWTGSAQVPVDRPPVSWKLAVTSPFRDTVNWEPGDNRRMLPPAGVEASAAELWSVRAHFGGASSAPQPCLASKGGSAAHGGRAETLAQRVTDQPKHPDVMKERENRAERPFSAPSLRISPSMPDLCMAPTEHSAADATTPGSIARGFSKSEKPLERIIPDPEEHLLSLSLLDASVANIYPGSAETSHVFAVIEGDQSRHQLSYDPTEERWTLRLASLRLSPGVYQFHFLVGDDHKRLLSNSHPVVSSWNVVLYSDPLRRYVTARSLGEKTEPACVTPHNSRPLGAHVRSPTSFSYSGSGGKSLEEQMLSQKDGAGSGLGGSDAPVVFGEDVLEGLFDGNLRFYLHGHALPPTDLLQGRPPDVQLWAGARRLMKVGGPVCEDACFYASHALGVADGVGGMKEYAGYGVDAAAYAEELLRLAAEALSPGGVAAENLISQMDGSGGSICPELRAVAAVRAAEQGAKAYGAATVVVTVLEGSTLGVANLGDSGFMVLRKGQNGMSIVTRSEDQQHPGFNTPYQLMRLPPALTERSGLRIRFIDTATDCQTYLFNLRPGDLILVFTDGLRDNLHDHEILDIANRTLPPSLAQLAGIPEHATPPECIARALAFAARERSLDKSASVPWVEYCRKKGHLHPGGGKIDDITVVAAWAVPA